MPVGGGRLRRGSTFSWGGAKAHEVQFAQCWRGRMAFRGTEFMKIASLRGETSMASPGTG